MELSYKKDGNENFMIIREIKINEDDYKLQMVINNKIEGVVPMCLKKVNNQIEIYYNISSMVALNNLYAKKQMTGTQFYEFVQGIRSLSETIKEYLLTMNNFILRPEFIFFHRQTKKYMFCFQADRENDFQEQLRDLFDKLLEYINHNDKEAVLMGYGIQQITIGTDYTVQDLVNCANTNRKKKYTLNRQQAIHREENYREIKIDQKDTKIGFFGNLRNLFQRKSKYKNESDIEKNGLDIFTSQIDDIREETYDTEEVEGETMLLTSAGMFQYVVLTCADEENYFRIVPDCFPYIIGKSKKSCNYQINCPVISRVHLKILENKDGFMVEDLNSTNGTLLNGERLYPHQPQSIVSGDKITIANLEFLVE